MKLKFYPAPDQGFKWFDNSRWCWNKRFSLSNSHWIFEIKSDFHLFEFEIKFSWFWTHRNQIFHINLYAPYFSEKLLKLFYLWFHKMLDFVLLKSNFKQLFWASFADLEDDQKLGSQVRIHNFFNNFFF